MNPWGGRGPAIPIPRKRYIRAAAERANFPSAAPQARRQIFFLAAPPLCRARTRQYVRRESVPCGGSLFFRERPPLPAVRPSQRCDSCNSSFPTD